MLWSFICLSGCLFTLVLAGALNELRWTKTISLDRPVPPITIAGLPLDTEYADDVDFNDKEEENLGAILPQATAILEKWNSLSMKTRQTLTLCEIRRNMGIIFLRVLGRNFMLKR